MIPACLDWKPVLDRSRHCANKALSFQNRDTGGLTSHLLHMHSLDTLMKISSFLDLAVTEFFCFKNRTTCFDLTRRTSFEQERLIYEGPTMLLLVAVLFLLGSVDSKTINVLVQPGGSVLLKVTVGNSYDCRLRDNLKRLINCLPRQPGHFICNRNISYFERSGFCQFQLDNIQSSGNSFFYHSEFFRCIFRHFSLN